MPTTHSLFRCLITSSRPCASHSKRVPRSLAVLLSLLALAVGGFAAEAPQLSLHDQSGNPQSLSSYRGKIVVLNFWATWCIPCRREMPMLSKLAEQYSGKDVVFLAASLDEADTRPKIPEFLEKKKVHLPIWIGATPDTLKQFDLGKMIPATIILDPRGEVIGRVLGQAREKDIRRPEWTGC